MADFPPRSKYGWGKKLFEALTRDQVEILLDVLTASDTLAPLSQELRTADPDLADTLQRLSREADGATTKDLEEVFSSRKLLENWNDLWGRWNDHVCEVGDEEGEYTVKDAD
jgi:hypothetical protein